MAELIEFLPLTRDGRVSAREADFTAIDVKTTGLRTGRVVELGVVRVRADGTVRGELATLVSPGYPLPPGPHRIDGEELAGAPSFGDVLGPLLDLCRGAVVVAHDLPLTSGFLAAEIARLGGRLPVLPGVSTMRAAQEVVRLPNYRLGTIARALGVGDYPPYLASASAGVCARVMTTLIGAHGLGFTAPPRFPELPRFAPGGRILRRPDGDVVENGWMSGVVDRIVAGPSDPTVACAYLDLLAESVGDQHLSSEEVWALAGLAADAGMTEPDVRRIHESFVAALRSVVEADGVVTAAEHGELRQVAAALDVPEIVDGLRPTGPGRVTRVLVLGTTAAADRLRARVLAEGVQLAKKLTASVTHLAYDDGVPTGEPRLARAVELGAEVVAVREAEAALGFETGDSAAARGSEGAPVWPVVEPTEVARWAGSVDSARAEGLGRLEELSLRDSARAEDSGWAGNSARLDEWARQRDSAGLEEWVRSEEAARLQERMRSEESMRPEGRARQRESARSQELTRQRESTGPQESTGSQEPVRQEEKRQFAPVAVPAQRVEPNPDDVAGSVVPRSAPRRAAPHPVDAPTDGLAVAPRQGSARVGGRVMMGIGLVLMFVTVIAMFGGAGVGAGVFFAVIGVGLLVGGWLVGEKGAAAGRS
ncbi:3'-5' exonuclease [Amycolatopsis saalfeldensis]|uniref:DNA polymerase III, epsilon subunit n=1 Tax=Amycolatopsis saalfeldensis TaxID=394193 RepID=A0A1H8YD97_9PSEU|nr:3'-5' exonuclease [Amycolatopsis saalfeldensis]SEP49438.1 DNA polymerase III, epsilon subunit [Amycolatopsis saalfeldensis]